MKSVLINEELYKSFQKTYLEIHRISDTWKFIEYLILKTTSIMMQNLTEFSGKSKINFNIFSDFLGKQHSRD